MSQLPDPMAQLLDNLGLAIGLPTVIYYSPHNKENNCCTNYTEQVYHRFHLIQGSITSLHQFPCNIPTFCHEYYMHQKFCLALIVQKKILRDRLWDSTCGYEDRQQFLLPLTRQPIQRLNEIYFITPLTLYLTLNIT